MLTTRPMNEFLDELASNSPAPGGGSVAALAGAIGAALTSMVCRLTIGKKKYADVQKEIESILQQSEQLRGELTAVIEEDTNAFNKVMAAFGLPKETEDQQRQRIAAVQAATKDATLVPLKVMQLSEQAIALAKTVAEKGNKNSISDAGVAALLLQAASSGAALNVRINVGSLTDATFVKEVTETMSETARRVESRTMETLALVNRSLSPA